MAAIQLEPTATRERLIRTASVGVSPRFRILDRRDAFYQGLEYEHLEHGWDGVRAAAGEAINPAAMPSGTIWAQPEVRVPVSRRRPTSPLRLVPQIVDRFTGLLFSEGRIPDVTVAGDSDANDFLGEVLRSTKFWRTMHVARSHGGSMGTTLILAKLRRGRFAFEAVNPKHITDIVWADLDRLIPAGVLIQYMFFQEVEEVDPKSGRPTGQVREVPYLYRRIVDEVADIVFVPARIDQGKMPAEMEVDEQLTYLHNTGEFPGAWVQNLPSDDPIDGIPDCDAAWQMIETIDRQLAQSNQGLLSNQDPTLVYGRETKLEQLGVPLKKGSENALNVGIGGHAQYLEIGGAGITTALDFVRFLRQAVLDKAQCVLVDPEKLSGAAQSARAIELIYQPMLEKAGRLRQQYEEAIQRLAEVILTMARRWSDPLNYEGNVERIHFHLQPRVVETDSGVIQVPRTPGVGGVISLEWGPYFAATPGDNQAEVATLSAAYAARAIDQETLIRRVAGILGIEDIETLIAQVQAEDELMKGVGIQGALPGDPVEVSDDGQDFPVESGPGIEADVQSTMPNGAQVQAAMGVVTAYVDGGISRQSAAAFLQVMFGLSSSDAERMLGPVDFKPEPPERLAPTPSNPVA